MTLKQNTLELASFRKNQLRLIISALEEYLDNPTGKPWSMFDAEGKTIKREIRRLIGQFKEELKSRLPSARKAQS